MKSVSASWFYTELLNFWYNFEYLILKMRSRVWMISDLELLSAEKVSPPFAQRKFFHLL